MDGTTGTALAFGTVTQEATASGNGRIAQSGGLQSIDGAPSRVGQHAEASDDGTLAQTGGGAAEVDQRAKASGRGHIAQTGGDQQWARASDNGRNYQAGRDQHVPETRNYWGPAAASPPRPRPPCRPTGRARRW
ncbi:hypothetical protein ACOZE3_18865 [Streptomyces cinereoruber]|uniref:hypothetical protein n=1 Tax=Streptomyces cinereoruber TaxID=67260 RepID=UPI003BF5CF9B